MVNVRLQRWKDMGSRFGPWVLDKGTAGGSWRSVGVKSLIKITNGNKQHEGNTNLKSCLSVYPCEYEQQIHPDQPRSQCFK